MFGWLRRWLILRELRGLLERYKETAAMKWLKNILAFLGGSKKATAVLVGLLTILLRDVLELDADLVSKIVQLILGYLVVQSAVDVALVVKGKKDG